MFLIKSDTLSAIMIVGAFRFPLVMLGIIEASTTRNLSTPAKVMMEMQKMSLLDTEVD